MQVKAGKRELLARKCDLFGLTRLVELAPKRGLLLVLNYHRIGDAEATPYDSGVFSATAEEFDEQIGYLKRRFHLTTLEEALDTIENGGPRHTTVLITFDDGYLDNYTLAFPVLRSHKVQGVFFLPTSFVGTGRLAWWDSIAYIVKKSRTNVIRLEYPETVTFDIERDGLSRVIMRILLLCARPDVRTERIISDLEKICGCARPHENQERFYLNWDEARIMQRDGMAFGSHTHTHEILTKLPADQQEEEFRYSREVLERELTRKIDTLAYPVGLPACFSEETKSALARTGYRAAFSFYGGTNPRGRSARYDIHRYAVGGTSQERFRLQTNLRAITGSDWG